MCNDRFVLNILCFILFNRLLCLYTGEHCEICVPTSYGNATVAPGCLPCECNGHGSALLEECDVDTGVCHCEEGYVGDNCEMCGVLSTGDPR